GLDRLLEASPAFERALAAQPDVAMVATSTTALVGAALAGIAPAVVSPRAVSSAVETGQLVVVEHNLDLTRPLTALWQRGSSLSPAAKTLLRIATRDRG
ncbi:MAG: LysR substrate-binding domain-containing protein, partial [Nocardioides sp.]|nr:LysR substrate-binding domain-containing protein [Nocardioides sp.]